MNPNAVVSTVIRIEPPLDRPAEEMLRAEGGLSVELEEGRRVRSPSRRRAFRSYIPMTAAGRGPMRCAG
jgi:hypothetical protein